MFIHTEKGKQMDESFIQEMIRELTEHNMRAGTLRSKTCEELGELSDVLKANYTGDLRGREPLARLVEETADVFIMLKQLCVAFNIGDEVAAMVWYKLARTRREIAEEK